MPIESWSHPNPSVSIRLTASQSLFQQEAHVPLGRKVFLAVVLSQLFSIALILGWYFSTLRSELGSLTRQRAQEAVLQSIAATEDYFKPAEAVVEAGQLLLSDHILEPDKPDPLERYFFGQLRLRPLLAGLYVGNSAGEFFYVMRSNEKVEGGTRTKGNTEWPPRPRGRADVAATRLRHCQK